MNLADAFIQRENILRYTVYFYQFKIIFDAWSIARPSNLMPKVKIYACKTNSLCVSRATGSKYFEQNSAELQTGDSRPTLSKV